MNTLPHFNVAPRRWVRAVMAVVLAAWLVPATAQNVFNGKLLFESKLCPICHIGDFATDRNNILNGANKFDVILAACRGGVAAMLPQCGSTQEGAPFDGAFPTSRAEAIDIAAYLGDPNGTQALVKFSRQALTFQRSANNGASPRQRFDIINTGNGAATLIQAEIQGDNASDYALLTPPEALGTTPTLAECKAGQVLTPFTFCSVDVAFTPGGQGTRTATAKFAFSDDSQVAPQELALQATVTQNQQSFPTSAVDSLNFGVTTLNVPSQTKTLVISNDGDADLTFDSNAFALSGANANDYTVQSDSTCTAGGQLARNGGKCDLKLAFSPKDSGNRSATLTVQSNANNDVTVQLAGVATATSENVGVGGCAIGSPDSPLDPLLLALCALALAVAGWRRRAGT